MKQRERPGATVDWFTNTSMMIGFSGLPKKMWVRISLRKDVVLKAYGGETLQLATEATKQGNDVVIAYGGDGTLNQVVNGVMNAKGQSMVSVIPGGTANEWATESGVPLDPFQAALALVNSE